MTTISRLFLTVAVTMLFGLGLGSPRIAEATCTKAQVCDDHGMNCHVQDVCDSTIDVPSAQLAPLTPLPSTQIKPLPSTTLPPLGTSHCAYKQVNGQWQNVCS